MAVTADNDSERLALEFFAVLSTGDLERVRGLLHEEVTWTPMVRGVPGAGLHVGKKGVVDDFLGPVRGLFKPGDPKTVIDSMTSKGPLVMLESHGLGHLADGRRYENLYAWAIETRDGRIFAIREYMDSAYVASLFPKQSESV